MLGDVLLSKEECDALLDAERARVEARYWGQFHTIQVSPAALRDCLLASGYWAQDERLEP